MFVDLGSVRLMPIFGEVEKKTCFPIYEFWAGFHGDLWVMGQNQIFPSLVGYILNL